MKYKSGGKPQGLRRCSWVLDCYKCNDPSTKAGRVLEHNDELGLVETRPCSVFENVS